MIHAHSISPSHSPTHTHTHPHTYTAVDRNDNSPRFEQSRYSFSIVENTDVLDPAVYVVTATDIDLGSNSEVYYDISDGNMDSVFVIGECPPSLHMYKCDPAHTQTHGAV